MALDSTSHDIYRGTSGITLPKELSAEIFEGAIAQSAIMKLAERVYLPGAGLAIPVITGDPTVSIVNEAAEKPVSNSTFTTKNMVPKKFAVIELVSEEFRRDLPRLSPGRDRQGVRQAGPDRGRPHGLRLARRCPDRRRHPDWHAGNRR